MKASDVLRAIRENDHFCCDGDTNKDVIDELVLSGLCGIYIYLFKHDGMPNFKEEIYVFEKRKTNFITVSFRLKKLSKEWIDDTEKIKEYGRFVTNWIARNKNISDKDLKKLISVYSAINCVISFPYFAYSNFRAFSEGLVENLVEINLEKKGKKCICPHCSSIVLSNGQEEFVECPNGHRFTI